MKYTKFFLSILFLLVYINSFCQKKSDFKNILALKKINKTFVSKSVNDTLWRTYLGAIREGKRKAKCYVVKEFFKTRAALTWHGHSTVYFFNLENQLISKVHLAMPDNLPVKLKDNIFYFEYKENEKTQTFKMKTQWPLPKVFCSRNNECDLIGFE